MYSIGADARKVPYNPYFLTNGANGMDEKTVFDGPSIEELAWDYSMMLQEIISSEGRKNPDIGDKIAAAILTYTNERQLMAWEASLLNKKATT